MRNRRVPEYVRNGGLKKNDGKSFGFSISSEANRWKIGDKNGMQNKENIVTNTDRGRNSGQESGMKSTKIRKHLRSDLARGVFLV